MRLADVGPRRPDARRCPLGRRARRRVARARRPSVPRRRSHVRARPSHGACVVADGLPPADGIVAAAVAASRPASPRRGSARWRAADCSSSTSKRPGWPAAPARYAFLVGCALVRRRQRSASGSSCCRASPAERALLEAVAELAASAGTVVTYNGKTFDLPLIETRFLLHGMATPFAGLPHVDMLHPARRCGVATDRVPSAAATEPAAG